MAKLREKIESILFVATHPLNLKKIAEILDAQPSKVEEELHLLVADYKERGGILILKNNKEYQMVTSPDCSKAVEEYVRKEETGELTRPQLESLTVIAYRGPITKPELDQIRGVNSALILRNLMIRGLVNEEEDKKTGMLSYSITMDFLRFLGLRELSELPDFERLRGSKAISDLLDQMKKNDAPAGGLDL